MKCINIHEGEESQFAKLSKLDIVFELLMLYEDVFFVEGNKSAYVLIQYHCFSHSCGKRFD